MLFSLETGKVAYLVSNDISYCRPLQCQIRVHMYSHLRANLVSLLFDRLGQLKQWKNLNIVIEL